MNKLKGIFFKCKSLKDTYFESERNAQLTSHFRSVVRAGNA